MSSVHVTPSGAEVWPSQWRGPVVVDKPSVLHGGVQVMDLVATTTCLGRWLPRDQFVSLLEREESVRAHVLDHLAREVLTQRARMVSNTMPANTRVADWLLARHQDSDGVVWRGSQEELGHVLGLSRVTVNRVLQRFAQAGSVELTSRAVRVVNRRRLDRFLAALTEGGASGPRR